MKRGTRLAVLASVSAAFVVGTTSVVAVMANAATKKCSINFEVANQQTDSFTANVTITNNSDKVNGWDLKWKFQKDEKITQIWDAKYQQDDKNVTATNENSTKVIDKDKSVKFKFNANRGYSGNVKTPKSFKLNGNSCSVQTSAAPTSSPTSRPTSSPTSRPTSPQPTSTGTQNPAPNSVADGWAGINAWDQSGTTGGAGGQTVTVTNEQDFRDKAKSSDKLIIKVSGMIELKGSMARVASNKTIVGEGSNSGFKGYGLNVSYVDAPSNDPSTRPADAVKNVILRNLKIQDSADDNINVQMFSHHIWIDHCDLSNPHDGNLDIKRGSSYVTVSWNYFHDADKNMLIGHANNNSAQDTGNLRVSVHHNSFYQTKQRNPRLRFSASTHIYNNYYYKNSSYGIASTTDAEALVEGNYFDSVSDPYHLREGDSKTDGDLVARDNCMVDSGTGTTRGSVDPVPYSYTLNPQCDIKKIVSDGVGVGKVGAP